jgi:hypothetical protein
MLHTGLQFSAEFFNRFSDENLCALRVVSIARQMTLCRGADVANSYSGCAYSLPRPPFRRSSQEPHSATAGAALEPPVEKVGSLTVLQADE